MKKFTIRYSSSKTKNKIQEIEVEPLLGYIHTFNLKANEFAYKVTGPATDPLYLLKTYSFFLYDSVQEAVHVFGESITLSYKRECDKNNMVFSEESLNKLKLDYKVELL